MELMLFDKVIAYDHLKQKIIIIINVKTEALEEGYRKASFEIDNIIKLIKQNISEAVSKPVLKSEIQSDISKANMKKWSERQRNISSMGIFFKWYYRGVLQLKWKAV